MRDEYDFSKMKMVKFDAKKIKKIILADHEGVDLYKKEVNRILKAIGNPEALVTDESVFRHFPLKKEDYKRFSKRFGMDIFADTTILTVAKYIKTEDAVKKRGKSK